MSDRPWFVDTNVLVYAYDADAGRKHEIAQRLLTELWASEGDGRVSMQVLQEFYVKVAQKWPGSRGLARTEVTDLLAWRPVAVSGKLIQQGWKIQDRYQLSFWDALIVAAAKAASCEYLLTEDLHPGQDLKRLFFVRSCNRCA